MSKWTKEKHNFLIDLRQSGQYTWQGIAEQMTSKFNHVYTAEQCRSKWRTSRHKIEIDPVDKYPTKIEKKKDGSIETDMLIAITREKLKDEDYILKAHGYDDSWEVVSHQYSAWQHHNKQDGTLTLYASKLRVKPKENKVSQEDLINKIIEHTDPIDTKAIDYKINEKRMLEIPLMDMHFGINNFKDYIPTLKRIYEYLDERTWDKVLITFGSDLMHVDNLKNTTANQTRIQDVDVLQMIEDTKLFYEHLIMRATKQSKEVEVVYIKGNHDETTSGLLIHWLDARFPNIKVDTEIEEVKVRTWEEVFIAFSHGDKGGKRAKNTLATKHPVEWSQSKIREFHKGHLHHEIVKDEFGITERTLPTGAGTDQFHKDNSFEGAHKRFQIFEYSGDWLRSTHYV